MSFVKKYFMCSRVKRNNCKKSILHLSAFSNATVVRHNGDIGLRYTPRSLKEITFIQVSPNIFEIDFELQEKSYLTNYYMFACSDEFSLFDILDEYMTDNFSTENWEIFEKPPYLNLCCSCTINVRRVGEKRNVFVNKHFYKHECVGSSVWFKSIFRSYENEDFDRLVCCGPDRKSLNDMLLRQLRKFCKGYKISLAVRYLLAYDVFFCVFKSIVIDRYFDGCLLCI